MVSCQSRQQDGPRPTRKRICQDCGRPATYRPPHEHRRRKHPLVGRDDHDLCDRCFWQRVDEAQEAA